MEILGYFGHLIGAVVGLVAIYWLAGRPPLPKWTFAVVALALAAFEFIAFKVSTPPDAFTDMWIAYYPAGEAIIRHDPTSLSTLSGKGVSGFVNIPIVAYLFAPLAMMPKAVAIALFTLVGVSSAVAAWAILCRLARLELRERCLLALLFLANGPLINGIKWANLSYYIVFALAAGLALVHARKSLAAGVLLGVAAVIKPALVIFGLYFLFRRDFKATLAFSAVGIITALLSLAVFGWDQNWLWFQECILTFSHGWLSAYSVQSVAAFIYRLGAEPGVLLDWAPHIPTDGQKLAANLVTLGLLILAALACLGRPGHKPLDEASVDRRRDLQYLLLVCLALVASPLTWQHYFCWLLAPMAFFLGPLFPTSRVERVLGWTAIALISPLPLWPVAVQNSGLMEIYKSFAISHFLFGALLWFFLIAWWLAKESGLAPQSRSSERHASANGANPLPGE